MSTANQMQAFQSRLTERLTRFAMEIYQEVAHIVKTYQEENECLRSLLKNVITTRGNIAVMDHNRLGRPATAVREEPPELDIPLETGAEPCAKRPKMEHTKPLTNVTEEKETHVLQPFASTTKEEQTEILLSSAVEESEPLARASMVEQTVVSEPSAIKGSLPLPDTPIQHQKEVSELLANESNQQQIEYNQSLALEQESGTDNGVTLDYPESHPKEPHTTARQAMAFRDVYSAMDFSQPSTSEEMANQDLLLQERPRVSPKKKGARDGKPKRKTVMTTIALKKELIAKWERGTRVSDLAVQYNMAKSTVSTILKRKEAIKAADVAKGVKTLSSRRTDKVEEVEKVLLEWITHKQLRGDTVSETLICDKARELHNALTRDNPGGSAEEFKASKGWFVNFKERSGIHGVLRPREAARVGKEDSKKFDDEFQNFAESQGFPS